MASALCASYIGGSVNFAAVSQSLGLAPGPLLAASMAADNIAMAAYLTAIMVIPAKNMMPSASSPSTAITHGVSFDMKCMSEQHHVQSETSRVVKSACLYLYVVQKMSLASVRHRCTALI